MDSAAARSRRLATTPPRWNSPFPADVAFRQAGLGAESGAGPAALPQERALLSERAAPRRVLEFALGRSCARAALAALAPERAAELAETPLLRVDARRPRWPTGFVGAITHHRGWAAAAVAWAEAYVGVGVDLEAVRTPSPALLARILRPEECEAWQALPVAQRNVAFMRVFSAKESLFKALYPHTGLFFGFQEATLLALPEPGAGSAVELRWRLERDCGPGFPAGTSGAGRALTDAGYVLTGVWVQRG